jgi:hypothetical protein
MKQCLFSRRLLGSGAIVVSLLTTAMFAGSAQADLISTDSCDNAALSQPFAGVGDSGQYKLVPGGDFENGLSGWDVSGRAHTVDGSEPFGATGQVGEQSLYLPAGSSVQSPFTCVDAAYPTFRFYGRNDGLLSTVLVQVVYKEPLGVTLTLPVGTFALSRNWAPSLPMLTGSVVQGVLSNGTAQVSLRFTALTGASQIDDVFVDPRMRS